MFSFSTLLARLLNYLRRRHAFSVSVADALLCLLAGLTAFTARFEFNLPPGLWSLALVALLVWLVFKVAAFHAFALHRHLWHYVSTPELRRIVQANLTGSVFAAVVLFSIYGRHLPRSIPLLDLILSIAYTGGARFIVRLGSESAVPAAGARRKCAHVLIYGAGRAGVALLREIRQNPSLGLVVSGFVDDDPEKRNSYIHGLPVLGAGGDLKQISLAHPADQVLIAISTLSAEEMGAIIDNCVASGLLCRILPGIEAVDGRALANKIRAISIEDLLGRHSITLDQKAIAQALAGNVVLVTGAAGSIGSELCRQIARHSPRLIIGYDSAETPLFFLEKEMREGLQPTPFRAIIGSVQDRTRLMEVMREFQPAVVYHAAAYKHVPVMEQNPFEAVANNIFGTECVLRAAMDGGVTRFVMVSTDKAVRPTNVMGTTKRIAELLVHAFSSPVMSCVSVRFGNVLGSNGSVVPIFQRQIARGGPVTVTHPEMRRYFMTIPEASQLVLQASAIGKSGEILVLDMGEPVKIADLATRMIELAGLRPGVDIEIQFSGVRPGEKLYEEINLSDESMMPTSHRSIRIFQGPAWGRADMERQLARIRAAWERRDTPALLKFMKEAVPEYNLNRGLLKQEESAPEPDDNSYTVTLLGNIDRRLQAEVLESNDGLFKLALEEALPVDAALRIEYAGALDLAEVCACSREGDGYVAIAHSMYRLRQPAAPKAMEASA